MAPVSPRRLGPATRDSRVDATGGVPSRRLGQRSRLQNVIREGVEVRSSNRDLVGVQTVNLIFVLPGGGRCRTYAVWRN